VGVHWCLLLWAWQDEHEEMDVVWASSHLDDLFDGLLPLVRVPSVSDGLHHWVRETKFEVVVDLVDFLKEGLTRSFISLTVEHSPSLHHSILEHGLLGFSVKVGCPNVNWPASSHQ
jgi:hypothetical protein